ncbi:MAG: phosphoribosylformylglycinamidine synthase subunit PurS [Acidimicrobiia bacterium]
MAQRFAVRVQISHLPGILDPQGVAIERALPALGYHNVADVHMGKTIDMVIEADDEHSARTQVDEMCRKLLANTVIEAYTIAVCELVA